MSMLQKIILVGNSEEFEFSMKLFPELLLRLLRARGAKVEIIGPKTVFGKLAPWAGRLGKWLFYIDKFVLFPVVLRWKLWREGGAGVVVHICDHSNAMYVPHVGRVPHLITCHDLMPIKSALGEIPQNPTSRTGKIFQGLILSGLKKARFIVCVSKATERDLARISGRSAEGMQTVPMALNYPYTPMPHEEARLRLRSLPGGGGPYILHVGGSSWYKNRSGLVAIYSELRRLLKARGMAIPRLVYVGPPMEGELQPFLQEAQDLAGDVIRAQGVDAETLRALYSCAELLLFPSWDEGFGWPIIEAQACGCRVVTTGKPPMTEVGGEAVFPINPADPASAARVVLGVLEQEPPAREASVQAGLANAAQFSEERMMVDYMAVYERLAREGCQ